MVLNRSCEPCRGRKLRCNGGRPCVRCCKLKLQCQYSHRKVKQNNEMRPAMEFLNGMQVQDGYVTRSGRNESLTRHTQSATSDSLDDPSLDIHDDSFLEEVQETIVFSEVGCKILLTLAFQWRIWPDLHCFVDLDLLCNFARRLHQDEASSPLTIDQALLLLAVISITLLFSPPNGVNTEPVKVAVASSPHFKLGRTLVQQGVMYALAKQMLQKRMLQGNPTLDGIQAAIVLHHHDLESKERKEEWIDRIMRWSTTLKLHRTTGYDKEAERKTRTWWFLVTMNWLESPRRMLYTVSAAHFTARRPLNCDFADLPSSLLQAAEEQTEAVWTPASYSLSLIELAATVRHLVDVMITLGAQEGGGATRDNLLGASVFQGRVQSTFDIVLDDLPWYYSTDPEEFGRHKQSKSLSKLQSGRIDLERWLLHLQIFHCLLLLLDPHSFTKDSLPKKCVQLAHTLLDTFDQFSQHCSLLGASSIPMYALVSASSIIAIDAVKEGPQLLEDINLRKVRLATEKAKRFRRHGTEHRDLFDRLERMIEAWQVRTSTLDDAKSHLLLRECNYFLHADAEAIWKQSTPSPPISNARRLARREDQDSEMQYYASRIPHASTFAPALQSAHDEQAWIALCDVLMESK